MTDRERISTSFSALRRTPLTPSHRDRVIESVLATPAPRFRARIAAVVVLVAMHLGWSWWVVVETATTGPSELQVADANQASTELLLGTSIELRRRRSAPEASLDEVLRW